MIPIPVSYLPHTAQLFDVSRDAWQKESDSPRGTLRHVRIEPCARLIRTKDNTEITLSAVLFYDCRNSSGADGFTVGQAVVFGDVRYRVMTVEALYGKSALHHYEVGLA